MPQIQFCDFKRIPVFFCELPLNYYVQEVNLVPIIVLPTKLFYEWQVITLWIVTAVRIMVIQNGKTDKAVLILKLWFFKHLVEELGYMRRGIAKGSTAQCSKHK